MPPVRRRTIPIRSSKADLREDHGEGMQTAGEDDETARLQSRYTGLITSIGK